MGTGADAHDSITHFPGGVGGTVTNGTGGGGAGKAYYRVTTQDGGLAGCFGGGSGSGAARAYTSNETNSSSAGVHSRYVSYHISIAKARHPHSKITYSTKIKRAF